jgi:hypothetical protein
MSNKLISENFKIHFLVMFFLIFINFCFGQNDMKKILKKINATEYKIDFKNEDGIFVAKNNKSKKWGMFQAWSIKKINEIIPVKYDSIDFFDVNSPLTGVWLKGKVGVYLSPWTFEKGKQSIPCLYDGYRIFIKETYYLALQKEGKWAWVDWISGQLKTDFQYELSGDNLPEPNFIQEY